MESAGNGGSGQRGNEKAVKIFVLWKRCGIVLRGRILPKADRRRTLSPLPAIFRIRGFDTGRGLGVNSAGLQDLGGGYLLLLHLILFLYSCSYKCKDICISAYYRRGSHALHALQNLQILWIYARYFMVAIGVNQSRIGGKPYGIVLTGIDRPVRVKIQGRCECNNGVQFCACGYRESEWPSGPKGRRFKSCHLDH